MLFFSRNIVVRFYLLADITQIPPIFPNSKLNNYIFWQKIIMCSTYKNIYPRIFDPMSYSDVQRTGGGGGEVGVAGYLA